MSGAWRSMVKAKHIFQKGSRWAIGNGCTTHFWLDSWLLDVPLYQEANSEIPIEELNYTVNTYWCPNGWDFNRLKTYLRSSILNKLSEIQIFPNSPNPDNLFWDGTSLGHFTVGLDFEIQNPVTNNDHSPVWQKI